MTSWFTERQARVERDMEVMLTRRGGRARRRRDVGRRIRERVWREGCGREAVTVVDEEVVEGDAGEEDEEGGDERGEVMATASKKGRLAYRRYGRAQTAVNSID